MNRTRPGSGEDRGNVLPFVLVIVVVLGLVVMSVATYATTNLKFGRVAEDRSDRLAAADAGLRYALDQIKLRARGCVWDDAIHVLPGLSSDFNEATARVECQRITTGLDDIDLFAAILTGEGVPTTGADAFLLSSQGGSNKKTLGGPVFMERIDAGAFFFDSSSDTAGVEIENGPLLYPDPAVPCYPTKPSVVVARASGKLSFKPDLVYGPECVQGGWKTRFESPPIVRNIAALPVRDGTVPLAIDPVAGSYTDYPTLGACRVFEPGIYTKAPVLDGINAYFKSGDYVFDFPDGSAALTVKSGVVTAGKMNPDVPTLANERPNTNQCTTQQALDPALDGAGATFYLAGRSRFLVSTNGAVEIHARKQGDRYVSVQTLCKPKGAADGHAWCSNGDGGVTDYGGGGGFSPGKYSTLNATSTPEVLYTNSGNGKEFIAHALFYAPRSEAEFGNVSNTAIQKMLGGIVVAQLVLQSATSATNFEIAVPTSPITGKIEVRSTAEKNGSYTTVQAVVEYRPYEEHSDDRLAVNSWRVCESPDC